MWVVSYHKGEGVIISRVTGVGATPGLKTASFIGHQQQPAAAIPTDKLCIENDRICETERCRKRTCLYPPYNCMPKIWITDGMLSAVCIYSKLTECKVPLRRKMRVKSCVYRTTVLSLKLWSKYGLSFISYWPAVDFLFSTR